MSTRDNGSIFPEIADAHDREATDMLAPKFGADGLVTCVVTDADDGHVLMLAHMNAEALAHTLTTGAAHFWSRSRQELWQKGATSGNVIEVVEMRVDCDQDAVWIRGRVAGDGKTCHTGARSCFYRKVVTGDGGTRLVRDAD